MARIRGTRRDDSLAGTLNDDVIWGGLGNDDVAGGFGNDIVRGGLGNDTLFGSDGRDRLEGGVGDDWIEDGVNYSTLDWQADVLKGGKGNDTIISGLGGDISIGNDGSDFFYVGSGHAWGDEGPGIQQRHAGNDYFLVDTGLNWGQTRTITGGRGADVLEVYASANEGVPTQVTWTDFRPEEGDILRLVLPASPEGYKGWLPTFQALDTNGDRALDGQDTANPFGHVSVDAAGTHISLGDGDNVLLAGVFFYRADDGLFV